MDHISSELNRKNPAFTQTKIALKKPGIVLIRNRFNQNYVMRQLILFAGFFLPLLAAAQLNGRVINEKREGIPFASVTVKNSSKGVTTDSTGAFSITHDQKFPF